MGDIPQNNMDFNLKLYQKLLETLIENNNLIISVEDYKINLEKLRNIVSVTTICMQGFSQSAYDSKEL